MPYCRAVISVRHCSKPGCSRPAVATLTYDYSDSTAVVGSLSAAADPNAYDLCEHHANSLTVPRGGRSCAFRRPSNRHLHRGMTLWLLSTPFAKPQHTPETAQSALMPRKLRLLRSLHLPRKRLLGPRRTLSLAPSPKGPTLTRPNPQAPWIHIRRGLVAGLSLN